MTRPGKTFRAFVEKEDPRVHGKGPGETGPLGLPSGKQSCRPVLKMADSKPLQAVLHFFFNLFLFQTSKLQPPRHIFENRRVKEERFLRNHGHFSTISWLVPVKIDLFPFKNDPTFPRANQVGKNLLFVDDQMRNVDLNRLLTFEPKPLDLKDRRETLLIWASASAGYA